MYRDVIDLKEFYETTLGRMAQRILRRRILKIWPDLTNMRLMGMGYATPYLRPYLAQAERVFAVMPATQGPVFWPSDGDNLVTLADEFELPLASHSVDRVLVVHGLEGTARLGSFLAELDRVLTGDGKALFIIPNRAGVWARVDRTPFGQGTPYSLAQVKRFLRDHSFVPEKTEHALFVPPTHSRLILSTAPAWERIGNRFFSTFGGVTIVEATKQLFAPTMVGEGAHVQRRRGFVIPEARPIPRSGT